MWLYGSGFPKSMNIGLSIDKKLGVNSNVVGINEEILKKQSNDLKVGHRKILDSFELGAPERNNGFVNVSAEIKEPSSEMGKKWKGWGTSLKPSFEPIIVARKPVEKAVINNVMKYGVGGINIDECRIDFVNENDYKITANKNQHEKFGTKPITNNNVYGDFSMVQPKNYNAIGRFPANTILTYDETDYEEVCGKFPNSKGASSQNNYSNNSIYRGQSLNKSSTKLNGYREWYNDDGSASRYFYCAKANKKDRDEGLENFEEKIDCDRNEDCYSADVPFNRSSNAKRNTHPTVKPTELMQYLIRLVTPKGGIILDPFMGSGSTGKAAAFENRERNANYSFIGIEKEKDYCEIAKARIDFANRYKLEKDFEQLNIDSNTEKDS